LAGVCGLKNHKSVLPHELFDERALLLKAKAKNNSSVAPIASLDTEALGGLD